MTSCEVSFPNLGIVLQNVRSGISVFGFYIAFYGMIITFGMICGYLMATWQAKRTGQDPEIYTDLALYAIIFSVIGARIYYVIFSWDEFSDNLISILNLRTGGLAIYGGVIGGVLTCFIFSRVKKVSFRLLIDTACLGLVTGQIIGRWGNFFNKEAFGGYTNNLLAMRLPWDEAKYHISSSSMQELSQYVNNGYIQVHPTFLYESMWNIGVLILLIFWTKKKKFDGELFLVYIGAYGLGRLWIESLRTDQLLLWHTNIPASLALSALMLIVSIVFIALGRKKQKVK